MNSIDEVEARESSKTVNNQGLELDVDGPIQDRGNF
jgi:hypothetical protein